MKCESCGIKLDKGWDGALCAVCEVESRIDEIITDRDKARAERDAALVERDEARVAKEKLEHRLQDLHEEYLYEACTNCVMERDEAWRWVEAGLAECERLRLQVCDAPPSEVAEIAEATAGSLEDAGALTSENFGAVNVGLIIRRFRNLATIIRSGEAFAAEVLAASVAESERILAENAHLLAENVKLRAQR